MNRLTQLFLVFISIWLIKQRICDGLEIKREVYLNGDIYEGEMENGLKSGYGKYKWTTSGSSYDGEWRWDLINGHGVFYYPDGSVYDGDFIDNERQGFGYYRSNSGIVYSGSWHEGYYHGHGTHTTSEEEYVGHFVQGNRQGIGALTYLESGDKYRGDFDHNQLHGYGLYMWANGDMYEGRFYDGLKSGKGSYFWAESGKVFQGWWVDGEIVSGKITNEGHATQEKQRVNATSTTKTTADSNKQSLEFPLSGKKSAASAKLRPI